MSTISDTKVITPRNWEETSLILDILIDCEEYKEFDEVYKTEHRIFFQNEKDLSDEFIKIDKDKAESSIEEKIIEIIKIWKKYPQEFDLVIDGSRFLRRLLKENQDYVDASKLYKDITQELIRRMPGIAEGSNLHRIVFLNEISACNEKNMAIGFADMALEELGEIRKGQKPSPHELYALYNKGLALLHDQSNTEGAIDTFLQTVEPFRTNSIKPRIDVKKFVTTQVAPPWSHH